MKKGKLVVLALLFFIVFGSSLSQAALIPAADRPGTIIYKMGDVEVIAIRDIEESFEINRSLLIGDAKRIEQLTPGTISIASSNTYVVRTKKSLILIDTGLGTPHAQTVENLQKIGITPDMVDTILLTHLHFDHVSGLLNDGKTVFPNAAIYLSAAERAYWFDDAQMDKQADKTWFTIARQSILAYGDRVRTFEHGTKIVPEIRAINLSGHTPGHTGYLVEAKDELMLIWGDLTHITNVQIAAPEIAIVYDADPKQAIITRQATLSWVARENILVAGMHVLYPGVGRIIAQDGGYIFKPLDKLD